MKFYAVLCCAIIATYTHDPWGFGHKLHIVTHSFSTGWFYGKVEEVNKGLVGIKNNGKGSVQQETKWRLKVRTELQTNI